MKYAIRMKTPSGDEVILEPETITDVEPGTPCDGVECVIIRRRGGQENILVGNVEGVREKIAEAKRREPTGPVFGLPDGVN